MFAISLRTMQNLVAKIFAISQNNAEHSLSLRLKKVSVRFLRNPCFLVDHQVTLLPPWPHGVLRCAWGSRPDYSYRHAGWGGRVGQLLRPLLDVGAHSVLRSWSNHQVTFPSFWPHHIRVLCDRHGCWL